MTSISIQKRDGRTVMWDRSRIERAIALAWYAWRHGNSPNANRDDPEAFFGIGAEEWQTVVRLSGTVEDLLAGDVTVDAVQDAVERTLATEGYWEVAKLYTLYRSKHDELRMTKYEKNGLQEYISISKYSRYDPALSRRETYPEAVDRVRDMHLGRFAEQASVRGEMASIIAEGMVDDGMLEYVDAGLTLAEEIGKAFQASKDKDALPSMRSLQFGGEAVVKNNARIFNCSFGHIDRIRAFAEAMYLLLSGTGVGFSVQKHHVAKMPGFPIRKREEDLVVRHYTIADTIEGWSDALEALMQSYLDGVKIEFNYAAIRAKGTPLKTSGGKAPGHLPLKRALVAIEKTLDGVSGRQIKPIEAYDILMFAARAVLAGGIRRSATIALFSVDDEEMANAKTGNWFETNPQRTGSNNSAVLVRTDATQAQFYNLFEKQKEFGEPGFYFSENPDYGTNPCSEIGLAPFMTVTERDIEQLKLLGHVEALAQGDTVSGWQMCNLTTVNGGHATTADRFYRAVAAAAFVGTLQASYTDIPYLGAVTRFLNEREALLGVSITGILDNPEVLLNPDVLERGARLAVAVNARVAKQIGIKRAARVTAVKPEGCQREDTMLITSRGILELGELGNIEGTDWQDVGEVHIATDRGAEPMGKFFVNGMAKTRQIKLSSGLMLEATLHHKYKVLSGEGEYAWKRADAILPGDFMPYRLGGYTGGTLQTLRGAGPIGPQALDEDMAWWLGVYYASEDSRQGKRVGSRARDIGHRRFGLARTEDEYGWHCVEVRDMLRANGLLRPEYDATIPVLIRMSPPWVIKAFCDGLGARLGTSYRTGSAPMARQLMVVLRAIGQDCTTSELPNTSGKGRFLVEQRRGRQSVQAISALKSHGLLDCRVDKVMAVEESQALTYDVEVPGTHTYLANSYVSHNTSSLLLGTGSGIHPHHAKHYLRRVQVNRLEPVYQFFRMWNEHMTEPSAYNPGTDDVVTFAVEAPPHALTKDKVTALTQLAYVKLVQRYWVMPGRGHVKYNPGLHHNVSNTISVKPEEWDRVRDFIWENREYFTGVSLLPASGDKVYMQAPLEAVIDARDVQKWNTLNYQAVPWDQFWEGTDETSLKDVVACAGGACEII